jgi:hypothetical protein
MMCIMDGRITLVLFEWLDFSHQHTILWKAVMIYDSIVNEPTPYWIDIRLHFPILQGMGPVGS